MQEEGIQLFSGHKETKRKRGEEGSDEEAHSPEVKLNRTCKFIGYRERKDAYLPCLAMEGIHVRDNVKTLCIVRHFTIQL